MAEKNVGDIRKFTNDERFYTIREILDHPGITMTWTWDSGICPHCKKKLTRQVNYLFYRIEVLGDKEIQEDKDLTISDITLLGMTTDGKTLMLTSEKYNEVFLKSEKFKELAVI